MHAAELCKLGANIRVDGRTATIPGNQEELIGTTVTSTDLRGGAALVLAGLVSEGKTEVTHIHHIERGYESFVEKLSALGAKIRREED